jgi:hypothetical protein
VLRVRVLRPPRWRLFRRSAALSAQIANEVAGLGVPRFSRRGHCILANMKDQFESAHLLFAVFQKAYDAHPSPHVVRTTLNRDNFED